MFLKRVVNDAIKNFLEERNIALVNYNASQERPNWIKSIREIRKQRPLLLLPTEASQLICSLEATSKIQGDIAEVGVAYGASAKLILKYSKGKNIHLFDTYEGLPVPTEKDEGSNLVLKGGEFKCSLDNVKNFLSSKRCKYYKGFFPATASNLSEKKFSFVHLDVDLYESTLEGLRFFYPRMTKGGIIISHDYPYLRGVPKAFEEYFADKDTPFIELAGGYQCMVVKI